MNDDRMLILSRTELCNISMALTGIMLDFGLEIRNENTTPERKEIVTQSYEMWGNLREKVKQQLHLQDKLFELKESTENK